MLKINSFSRYRNNSNIKDAFSENKPIHDDLPRVISQYYSFIIEKGFKVYVNDQEIKPKRISLLISESGELEENTISPFLYKANIDNVSISLAVGFYRQMIDSDELDEEQVSRRSSSDAGWTVVCNDRVVLYNDKSMITGWGDGTTPSYHTQFIGILGVVFFSSNDPKKLPLTTTKRNLEMSSKIYLYIRNIMKEGLKKFTDYTYKWKANADEERQFSGNAKALDIREVIKIQPNEKWKPVQNRPNELKLSLQLARPKEGDPLRQVKFSKRTSEINIVNEYVFGQDQELKVSALGEYCFDYFLTKAKR